MNLIKALSSSFLLKSIFAISLFILIFISSISYKNSLSLADSTSWVLHSYKINIRLEQLFSYVKDAETGQRGYIITRDSAYLIPYSNAKERVAQTSLELENLCADNDDQIQNLKKLNKVISSRISHLDATLKMTNRDTFSARLLNANMMVGRSIMDNIRFQISKMIALELEYLKKRQSKYEDEISFSPIITLLFLLFALIVFIFSYWKINRDLNNLTNANARLMITNASTTQAEEIGAFSSWQWDLETNKLTYSDNQYVLLGCKPQSFEPTIEKYLEFVHPDDRHIITDGSSDVLERGKYPAAYFRIIRKDGELRYFKSLSKLVVHEDGKRTLIGVNKDITEFHFNQAALEERNRELELKNKELASFNHVASHDLQEPLRIIQTYISRFNEKETSLMTDKGREYLSKIRLSVTRMRTLIDDLLLFSRINTLDKIFECTDLNYLLEGSKDDLAQIISEKGVVIHSVDLPTVKVIPFQIQQLFTNLLSNSIKYRRTDVPPVIRIECDKVIARNQPELKNDSQKVFYKISVIDNGMGFEQAYADQIFGLFHRLHHEREYPGTGIGLSICKKIVENNGGFIIAEGRPDDGATFSVFLPL